MVEQHVSRLDVCETSQDQVLRFAFFAVEFWSPLLEGLSVAGGIADTVSGVAGLLGDGRSSWLG